MSSNQNKILSTFIGNKKFLLNEAGYKSIVAFKKDFPLFKTDDKIFKYLLTERNRIVYNLQEQKKEQDYALKLEKVLKTNRKKHISKEKDRVRNKETNKRFNRLLKAELKEIPDKTLSIGEKAYKSYISYILPRVPLMHEEFGFLLFAEMTLSLMLPTIKKELAQKKMIKVYSTTPVFMRTVNGLMEYFITVPKFTLASVADLKSYQKYFVKFMVDMLNYYDSQYSELLESAGNTSLNVTTFKPFQGKKHAPIPKFISDTKGIVNIKNKDEKCFLWCLIASRHPAESHVDRLSNYDKPEYIAEWKFQEKDIPMKIDRIAYFERANKVNINVYTVEDDKNYADAFEIDEELIKDVDDIFGDEIAKDNKKQENRLPLYVSKQKNEEVINLFLYNDHYSLIKNFSRFCGSDGNFTCANCLACYSNRESYKTHVDNCRFLNENGTLVSMPKDIKIIDKEGNEKLLKPKTYFKKYSMMKKLPVVIYADFESNLEATEEIRKGVISKHVPNSYRIHIVSVCPITIVSEKYGVKSVAKKVLVEKGIYNYLIDDYYTGKDCPESFIEMLLDIENSIQEQLKEISEKNYEPRLTNSEELEFQKSSTCHLCNLDIFNPADKVRDHDHFTGKYEGCAHSKCNVKAHQMFKGKIKIPVFFHNANYDMKCFIQAFHNIKGNDISKMNAIPCNMENYKALTINNYEICCSYAHLSLSLDKLIKNLPENKKTRLRTIVGDDEEKFKLINKKGLYPYELITSLDKLSFPIEQLKRDDFDSKLCLSKLTDDDWEHVQKVIRVFGFTNFKEYHDLYLKIDVLGLADVFEYYRELSFESYGLDPAHCIGLPQFTWQAGLKSTGVKLDEIQDQDMYIFFEKMKRGGISVISHKHAKANNKYLPEHNDAEPSSYLMQLDSNSLYSKAMYEMLPTGNFIWDNADAWSKERILNYDENSKLGYGLEVDLQYPKELHDEHNDYPLAPEKIVIDKIEKLAPNFKDKKNYVVHINNLKYYLEKGLVLVKVHKVVRFEQSRWLKPYILGNIVKRQAAKNDFEKDFYKLMNNAFFGKTMEDVRDRVNVRFCLDQKSYEKNISSPLFASKQNLFAKNPDEDGLRLVQMHKKTVLLNKPLYVGATIMELSKVHMYKFHYDTMKKIYPNNVMLKTDTDSLLYYIETPDLYEDFKTNEMIQKQIEFSNYPKNHMLYNCDRKKEAGLFQDESVDGDFVVISEYCGLRAKSYANKLYNVTKQEYETKKKSKGVPSLHVKKRITFDDYKDCLGVDNNFENTVVRLGNEDNANEKHRDKIYCFRSFNMQMYSVEMSKIALSAKDDKRHLQEDKIHTYALGHYLIK